MQLHPHLYPVWVMQVPGSASSTDTTSLTNNRLLTSAPRALHALRLQCVEPFFWKDKAWPHHALSWPFMSPKKGESRASKDLGKFAFKKHLCPLWCWGLFCPKIERLRRNSLWRNEDINHETVPSYYRPDCDLVRCKHAITTMTSYRPPILSTLSSLAWSMLMSHPITIKILYIILFQTVLWASRFVRDFNT